MAPKKGTTRKRTRASKAKPKTLAGVSQQGMQEMLSESQEGKSNELSRLDKISECLKAPSGRAVTVGECGAPAYHQKDEDNVVGGSDIEWEELEGPAAQDDDAMKIDLEIDRHPEGASQKLTKEERAIQKQISQLMLATRVACGMRYDRATSNALLQGLMMSMLPRDLIMNESEDRCETIEELFVWFNKTFTRLSGDAEEGPPKPKSVMWRLKTALEAHKGAPEVLTCLFAAVLKAVGFQTRTVRLFEVPKSIVPKKKKQLQELNSMRSVCWCEVWIDKETKPRWVHVDPLQELIDRPDEVGPLLSASANAYIVAYYGGGLKDVSVRYISNVKRCEQLRRDKWWNTAIKPLSRAMRDALRHGSSSDAEKIWQQQTEGEDEELRTTLEARRKLEPKSIEDFKHSLNYILPRHIKRYEALKPKAEPVGEYRGESYYHRSDLAELHSAPRWRQFGRTVKEKELPKPYKQVKSWFGGRKKKKDIIDEFSEDEEGEGDDSDELLGLYGYWQTKKWQAPVAKNGIVPKNEYGKVDIPPLVPSLPKNTTHLTQARLIPICRELGIDFGLATVGFEPVGCGRLVPKEHGIIICSEFVQTVMNAYEERQRHKALMLHQAEMESGMDGWRRLLMAIQAHLKLQQKYAAAQYDCPQQTKQPKKQRKKP